MNSWNFDQNSNNNKKAEFTKFPVGVTRITVLDEAPFIRWTHWIQKDRRSVNCPGRGCPICEIRKQQKANKEDYTYNMSRRFALNIYNHDTGKVEIMEQGLGFFEDLRDLKEEIEEGGNTLNTSIIRVKRRGTGKDDTSYRLDIDEVGIQIPEKVAEDIIDLSEYFKAHTPEQVLRIISGESFDEVMRGTSENNGNEENEEDFEVK
jgi:hypothetical protein